MTDDAITTTTCRCGQLRITVHGAPMLTGACHCAGCQAMTASAFSLGVMYHQDAVVIEGDTVLGGMKADSKHHCCRNCLGWMFTRAEAFGPMINIHSAALGQLQDTAPFMETCASESLAWVKTGAAHSFAQFPDLDQLPALLAEFAATRS